MKSEKIFLLLFIFLMIIPLFASRGALAQSDDGGDGSVDLSALDGVDLPDEGTSESAQEPESVPTGPANVEETPSPAPSTPESDSSAPDGVGTSFWTLVKAGGWIGLIIFLLSLVSFAQGIRLLLLLRRRALLPPELEAEFRPVIEKGRIPSAMEACRRHPSLLATVLNGGLKNLEGGWSDVEKGLEETLSAETGALYRKADLLMVVGNIAPMLGLLGTVLGMVMAFGELASSDGLGRFANLAQGIYFALVTTVDGLIVAIPTLALYSLITHRIAHFTAETVAVTEELMTPVKRYFQTISGSTASPLPPRPLSPAPPTGTVPPVAPHPIRPTGSAPSSPPPIPEDRSRRYPNRFGEEGHE